MLLLGACTHGSGNPLAPLLGLIPTPTTSQAPCGNNTSLYLTAIVGRGSTLTAGTVTGSSWGCYVNASTTLVGYPPANLTAASVVLPGGSTVALPVFSNGSAFNAVMSGNYQPGGTYTFHAVVSGVTYSGSLVAPGGSVVIPSLSAPGPITWAYTGNEDVLFFVNGSFNTGGTLIAQFANPASGSVNESGYFPTTTNYEIELMLQQQNTKCPFSPAVGLGSYTAAYDAYYDFDQ